MSEFDELQKMAIPSAAENKAGDEPFKDSKGRLTGKKRKTKRAGKVSAKEAEKSLGKEPEPEPTEYQGAPLDPVDADGPIFAHLDEPPAHIREKRTVEKVVVKEVPEDCKKYKEFTEQVGRATIELNDGTFTVPVITVRESKYSVMVVTSMAKDTMVFVPKPGTQLTLSYKDKSWDVFCPGAYVEFEELGLGILALIKAE